MLRFAASIVLILVFGLSVTQAQDDGVTVDIPYAGTDDPLQTLDVYTPDSTAESSPAILLIHGGGFVSGAKEQMRPLARLLAREGYVVVVTDYRLAPASTYPAHVEDVMCAFAWLHANADTYGIDRGEVTIWGGSAGGTLSLMIGTVDHQSDYLTDCPYPAPEIAPNAVIAYYPGTDFVSMARADSEILLPYMGSERTENPELWEEASPITHVDGSEPPFLLIHGTEDATVPVIHSTAFVDAVNAAGGSAEAFVIEGAEHGFMVRLIGEDGRAAYQEAVAFLERIG